MPRNLYLTVKTIKSLEMEQKFKIGDKVVIKSSKLLYTVIDDRLGETVKNGFYFNGFYKCVEDHGNINSDELIPQNMLEFPKLKRDH